MTQNNRPVRRPGDQPSSRFGSLDSERPVRPRANAGNTRNAVGDRPAQGRPNAARGQARPAAPRPAAPRMPRVQIGPNTGALPRGFIPLVVVCVVIIALGLVLQGMMPNGFVLAGVKDRAERPVAAQVSEIHGDGPIRINEIMSANGGVLVDDRGETPDWVEVANIGSRPVNLQGYVLAKSAKAGNVFVFPDRVLQAGECVVVYADSTLQDDGAGELHAPFRLSSGSDVLMLFNDADVAVDTVNIPSLSENTAYVRTGRNSWTVSGETTPGMLNTEENYRVMTTVVQDSPVQLAEIVASNTRFAPDESGVVHDYVMLRNTSGEAVDIGGWYLSDNPRLPRLWKFPDGVTLPGGGILIVYCSGLNRTGDPSHLHTGFRLSSEGETVTLSNAKGQPVDSATYDLLHTDEAWLRGADGNWSVGAPTAASTVTPAVAAAGSANAAPAEEIPLDGGAADAAEADDGE